MTPRSPKGRDQTATTLGNHLPPLTKHDARMLIDRIAHLLDAGEPIGTLLARLNPPPHNEPGAPPWTNTKAHSNASTS